MCDFQWVCIHVLVLSKLPFLSPLTIPHKDWVQYPASAVSSWKEASAQCDVWVCVSGFSLEFIFVFVWNHLLKAKTDWCSTALILNLLCPCSTKAWHLSEIHKQLIQSQTNPHRSVVLGLSVIRERVMAVSALTCAAAIDTDIKIDVGRLPAAHLKVLSHFLSLSLFLYVPPHLIHPSAHHRPR